MSDLDQEGRCVPAYYVYVVRCENGSLYTGICTDVTRRLREHRTQGERAARYTRAHAALSLEGLWAANDRSSASRLEWRVHHMTRTQKLELLESPWLAGEEYPSFSAGERRAFWEGSNPS